VYQRANAGYHIDQLDPNPVQYDQSVIAQCCPEVTTPTGIQPAFFAKKACANLDCVKNPITGRCPTSCGPALPGKCAACDEYSYPVNTDKCTLRTQYAHRKDELAPGGKAKVYTICARYAWTCGDGVCDIDEDCGSCEADCGCHDDQVCIPDAAKDGRARCGDPGDSV
jgi:hypothetical protein